MAAALKKRPLVALATSLAATFAGSHAQDSGIPSAEPGESPAPPPAPLVIKKYAGDVFNLDRFRLQIPIDDDGDGISDVVSMPLLRNFEDPAFFHIDKKGEAIVFRARRGDARMEGADRKSVV